MPRFRVFLTDPVTAGFDVEATPEAAAEEVDELSTDDGELVHAETSSIEVCATDPLGSPIVEPVLYAWRREAEGGEGS